MERNRKGTLNIYKDFLKETAKNVLMGNASFQRWRAKRPRAFTTYNGSEQQLERYAFLGLNLLEKYCGGVKGKSVCEIGAGDFLTSGLAILAAGASFYADIDRFAGDFTSPAAKQWYRGIQDSWSRIYPDKTWAEYLNAEDFPENYEDRLEIIREPIEIARTENRFDIVCSFQVGDISDIDSFVEMNKRLLVPDTGVALHRVDFGPHDCWFWYADPLTYLRFNDKLWRMTGSNRGIPNRFRHHEFMDSFSRHGFTAELFEIAYFDEKTIEFSRLQPKFQQMPRESMLVGTALYLLRQK
jgi:hypothetical protein